jgi:ethanolamine ammonia-lyase small subunit
MSIADPWADLRAHTAARLALGRSGTSLPTEEVLRFGLAHAQARDAVHRPLDVAALESQLQAQGLRTLQVASAAADRTTFLLRPDLGRRLAETSRTLLDEAGAAGAGLNEAGTDAAGTEAAAPAHPERAEAGRAADSETLGPDLVLVVADGLSAPAIARNAVPMLAAIERQAPAGWRVGPVVIATQARVALGDEIGQALGAGLVAMLIGERPGLSSPDSLGIYLTWRPRVGRSDAERNCISNIRPEGLGYDAAAHRFWWLCREARHLRLTGVRLKDGSDQAILENTPDKRLQG